MNKNEVLEVKVTGLFDMSYIDKNETKDNPKIDCGYRVLEMQGDKITKCELIEVSIIK